MRSRLRDEIRSHTALSAISILEQRLFLGERLLRDTDATSMAASIEVRLPLVDQVLLKNVNRMHERERYYPLRKKAALRRIGLEGLDPALFERPKTGFELPFNQWLRKGLGKVLDQTMRDTDAIKPIGLNPAAVRRLWQAFLDGAPGLYWSRVWALYVLIRWCHRHKAYV
jgi:asparagine synthase (glutamine-hydrolysing)